MYVCVCVFEDQMQEAEDDAKVFQIQGIFKSHQKNPCYICLMKICHHGAKIFNKMCSLEVSVG